MPTQSNADDARRARREDVRGRMRSRGTTADAEASTVDSFVNFAQKLGIGTDSPMSTASYGFNPITRQRQVLEWMYRGAWIAGLAVGIPADDMTRCGIEFETDMPPDQLQRIDEVAERLATWSSINEVVRWGRLYGGCLGVVLIDGQDLCTPLNPTTVGPAQYRGLAVLDRWMVQPELTDMITDFGPDLGLPKYYRVLANAPSLRNQVIHHTRVAFRVVGDVLPYQQKLAENMWGASVLERLYDRMSSFDAATTGIGHLIYKAYLRTLKVKNLRQVVAAGGKALDGLSAYTQQMARYQNMEGISLIDADDELSVQTTSAFSGLSDALMQLGQQVSGALGIPLTRLFGQSPAGLNSTGDSDWRTYENTIQQAQNRDLRPGVQLVYTCIANSLGTPLPRGSTWKFKPLTELTQEQKGASAKAVVEAVVGALDAALISEQGAMRELKQSSRHTGIFTNIQQEDIAAADSRVNPPPDAGELMQGLMDSVTQQPTTQPPQEGAPDVIRPQEPTGPVPPRPKERVRVQRPAA